MIIECKTCHARFRLDESRIKGRGARVKCRKCGDSIVVLKGDAPAPPAPGEDGSFDLGSAVRDSVVERPSSRSPDGNLIPFPAPESSSPAVEGAAQGEDEVDLAFNRFLSGGVVASSPSIGETEAEIPAPKEPTVPEEPEAPAGSGPRPDLGHGALTLDLRPEEKLDLPPAAEPTAGFQGEGGFLISDSDALEFLQEKHRDAASEASPGVGDISPEISAVPVDETSCQHEPDVPPPPHDDWASPAPEEIVPEGDATPSASPIGNVPPYREAEPGSAPASESPVAHRPTAAESPRPRSSAGPAMAAVLAILLVAGGYLGLTTSGRRTLEGAVPGIAALWGGNPAVPETTKYDLRNVIGYYESGAASPRILVIKGQVANLSKAEKSGIRVHAALLYNTDAVLVQQVVYAGNVLTGEAIRKGDRDALSKTLGNRFGEGLANMHVAPGKAIPFMVVFFDAPAIFDSYKLEAKDGE